MKKKMSPKRVQIELLSTVEKALIKDLNYSLLH